jgi:HTH-type transcriptional regulator/antitoxin HipB
MAGAFPVRFPDQLRQHLRALRKGQGLTQAQLGALVGVSQARIAEIEANPGLVNFEQLMKLLSALGITLTLHEAASAPAPIGARDSSTPVANTAKTPPSRKTISPKSRSAAARSKTPRSRIADKDVQSAPRPAFVVGPKKGSW